MSSRISSPIGKFALIDGEARNRARPETFSIPSLRRRQSLRIGEFVKIGWEDPNQPTGCNGERLWVRVVRREDDAYHGVISNDPVVVPELADGSAVVFQAKHVLSVE